MRPRWFGWLSDDLTAMWIDLLMAIERRGMWPKVVMTILVHLLPKPTAGKRPVGVLPSVTRWWEKLSKPELWRWRAAAKRDYDWAAKGRSAQDAVYGQALRDEAALARGHCTSTVLFDLVKAYEMVRLELVWRAGIAHKFPLTILRLVLEACAFVRVLCFNGATTDGVYTLSAILAGGGAAQEALLLVLLTPVDRLVEAHPMSMFLLYVDDLGVHSAGEG